MRLPKLCRNKTRDRAFVLERGKRIYLGKWGAPETEAAYQLYIHNLTSRGPREPIEGAGVTIIELAAAFFEARAEYYVKNGKQTNQLARFRTACEFPVKYYGSTVANEFGPKRLLECRNLMETSGRFSRRYINTLITCFRSVVKFGVERELVRPETLTALQAIAPLKRGRSVAGELPPVQAVDARIVETTCEALAPTIAAMVRLQRYTGMRPGEVCQMRAGDIFVGGGEIWIYTIRSDKTDYRRPEWAKKRVPLGPKAQAILTPYLIEKEGEPDAFLFSPEAAAQERALELRRARKTPATKQTRDRDARQKVRRYAPCYDAGTYGRAIARATKALGLPRWSPNQLRHLYATEIRAKFGLEASQLMLGHSNANVTQIYAERDFNKAIEIARVEG